MPIAGCEDERRLSGQPIDLRDHAVPVGNGERAARAEVILHVDDD